MRFTPLISGLVAAALAAAAQDDDFKCTGGTVQPYIANITDQGCWTDDPNRTLPRQANTAGLNSPQNCANACGNLGYKYAGVEYTTQCYCGNELNPIATKAEQSSSTCQFTCPGNSSAVCGGEYYMNLYEISNPKPGAILAKLDPICKTNPFCSQKACDKSLSMDERIAALLKALTLEEKIQQTIDAAAGVARIGLPPYEWWSEALHGVAASPGVSFLTPNGSDFSYATSFPMPILMSAAFDNELIHSVASVIGKEFRAFANYGFAGRDAWTPNINTFKDPRWGRGLEVPGEDSYHVSKYVEALIPGLQGGLDDPAHKQMIATCKHYAVYDVETGRSRFNYNPTQQDEGDYYLAPFKKCVRDVKVGSIMCSYNSVDGIPTCASEYLLQDVLRKEWGFTKPYHYVVSDCDAPANVWNGHNFTADAPSAAAVSLNAGTDLDCGTTYLRLNDSIAKKYTSEKTLDKSLTRLYHALFTVGYFDGDSRYDRLGWKDVSTGSAQSLAYTAAVEGMTLLKNDGLLPLKKSYKKVAVIGPWANATTQMQGNYQGTAPYLNSPLTALKSHFKDITYAMGTAINATNNTGFDAAITAAKAADLIIYLGGIDTSIEAEGNDRESIVWPSQQLSLINQLAALNKPLAIVQFGAGQLDDSTLLKNKKINALLWAGYPGQNGGYAVLDTLIGKKAPAGRLPITQYPASYTDSVSLFDVALRPTKSFPGRTYKWYTGKPVLPFGYGLHYTKFSASWKRAPRKTYAIADLVRGHSVNDNTPFTTVTASIRNVGTAASDYVALLFVSSKNAGPAPRPNKSLVSYARARDVRPRATSTVSLPLTLGSVARANEDGDLVIWPGDYEIALDVDGMITGKFRLEGKAAVIEKLPRKKAPEDYKFTVPVKIQTSNPPP